MDQSLRKLVTVQRIAEVKAIPNADAIEVATIKGWKVVVKKGEFKEGDLCIYFEIDSFLPIKPEFEFLRKSCYRKLADGSEGFRIKTCEFRKQISQGLVLPLQSLPSSNQYAVGDDVTELLEVIKFDPPLPAELNGKAKGFFPTYIHKADQERIQNLWQEYKKDYDDTLFEITLKLDGTSSTFFYNEGQTGVCSRNLELEFNPDSTQGRIEAKYKIFEKLINLGLNIAIQGEIYGEGVQGNHEKIKGQSLAIFDIFSIDDHRYLTPKEREEVLVKLDLQTLHIPVIDYLPLSTWDSLDDLLNYADGKSLNAPIREGIVFKSMERQDSKIVSFKVISNQFLLKAEK